MDRRFCTRVVLALNLRISVGCYGWKGFCVVEARKGVGLYHK